MNNWNAELSWIRVIHFSAFILWKDPQLTFLRMLTPFKGFVWTHIFVHRLVGSSLHHTSYFLWRHNMLSLLLTPLHVSSDPIWLGVRLLHSKIMIMAINVEPDSRTLSSSIAWPWKSHYMRKSVFRDLRLTDSLTARKRVDPAYTLLSMRGSRIFRQGGGGGQVNLTKKAWQRFLVLSLFYWSRMVNLEETIILQGPEWVQHFPGGRGVQSNPFPGGPIAYTL